MDHQRAFVFLALLQSGCWLAISAQRSSKLSSNRFRFRGVDSGSDPVFRCLESNCAASLRSSPDLLINCVRMHCSSSSSSPSAPRTARGSDYRLSLVPVGLPWSFHRLPIVLCPASSVIDNEALRYCTPDGCFVIVPGQSSGTGYERLERTEGSHCLRMCSDLGDGGYEDCVSDECCSTSTSDLQMNASQQQQQQQLSRKRRVNDDVSQCIQSYCSGYSVFRERILCIVKNCNRPVLTS